jgi:hypothetical protein
VNFKRQGLAEVDCKLLLVRSMNELCCCFVTLGSNKTKEATDGNKAREREGSFVPFLVCGGAGPNPHYFFDGCLVPKAARDRAVCLLLATLLRSAFFGYTCIS